MDPITSFLNWEVKEIAVNKAGGISDTRYAVESIGSGVKSGWDWLTNRVVYGGTPDIPRAVAPTSPQTSTSMATMPGNPDDPNSWTSDRALSEAWAIQQANIQGYFTDLGNKLDVEEGNKQTWLVVAAIAAGVILIWKL